MANEPRTTTVVGEDKAPITTLAIGEETVITTLVGEQAQPHPDYASVFTSDASDPASATTVVGESWQPPVTTTLFGEHAGGARPPATTEIAGEDHHWPIFTTTVVGEEGCRPPFTTTVFGEDRGPGITTKIVGEEGPATSTLLGEGGPFGNY